MTFHFQAVGMNIDRTSQIMKIKFHGAETKFPQQLESILGEYAIAKAPD